MGRRTNGNLLAEATPLAWANLAAQNTPVVVELNIPPHPSDDAGGPLLLEIINPSSVTAITITFETREDVASVANYFALADYVAGGTGTALSFTCAASTKRAFPILYGLNGKALRITFKNATVLGGADAFSATLWVRSY